VQADWGPLQHVRVIKERSSGVSRGFAFVDFPSTEAAQKMMDTVGNDGLVVDGRRLFFEYRFASFCMMESRHSQNVQQLHHNI
jgi:RNA recognition motif-containing protein